MDRFRKSGVKKRLRSPISMIRVADAQLTPAVWPFSSEESKGKTEKYPKSFFPVAAGSGIGRNVCGIKTRDSVFRYRNFVMVDVYDQHE